MSEPRVSEALYDAVAIGMWTYVRSVFRPRLLWPGERRLRRRTILVSTHRSESDVPLICALVFLGLRLWRDRAPRLSFAARDDMFDRGFFAGFPPGLPLWARRLLYPIAAGRFLPLVRVNPVPYPSSATLRLGRALEALPPETRLDSLLPLELLEGLRARAGEARLPQPTTARAVLRGEYADLLWELCTREQLADAAFDAAWRRRAAAATEEIRRVVELVRSGEPVLFFPEGRPSPDGAIGPLLPGLGMLGRRGQPKAFVPVAIAYDVLTTGRPWAYLGAGGERPLPADGLEESVLRALKQTMPLTCGQVVAHELVAGAWSGSGRIAPADLERALVSACAAALAEGRPFDRMLLDTAERRRRLSDALAWAVRSGLAEKLARRELRLAREPVLADPLLRRVAREFASAREEDLPPPRPELSRLRPPR